MGRFMHGAEGRRLMHGGVRGKERAFSQPATNAQESGEFPIGDPDCGWLFGEEAVAPESSAAAWASCSDAYQSFAEGLTRPFAWDAVRLVRIEAGSRVLDVATGTGEFAFAAAERGGEVLATDFSPSMLALVERNRQRRFAGSIATALMDGQALSLETSSFDAAGSLFGLVFFPDPTRGLFEMFRVLKPGGQAVVATWALPGHVEIMRIVGEALMDLESELPARTAPTSCWTSFSNPRRLSELMSAAGFRSVHVVSLSHVWTFDQVEHFARSVLRMTPSWLDLYVSMKPAQKDAFTNSLVRSFRERQGNGPYAVTAQGLVVVGTKPRD